MFGELSSAAEELPLAELCLTSKIIIYNKKLSFYIIILKEVLLVKHYNTRNIHIIIHSNNWENYIRIMCTVRVNYSIILTILLNVARKKCVLYISIIYNDYQL